ncbi:hypothetical protein Bca4012_064944 [Brassica carinata]
MQMQQQLQEAQRQLQEQAVLIAKGEEERSQMAKAEEERSQVIATQQLELNELRLVNKYMKATDPKYLAFLASETTTADPPQQQVSMFSGFFAFELYFGCSNLFWILNL